MLKIAFSFPLKLLAALRCLNFSLDFLVNFKIYDVTTCLTNNYNTHIAQYLTK